MQTIARFMAPLSQCGYLPDERWQLEYEFVAELSADEYARLMCSGWRRFGHSVFRPQCPACQKCLSLRVRVADFTPNRSQRRNRRMNEGEIHLQIGKPRVSRERLALYDRYHEHQSRSKDWPLHGSKDAISYFESFVANPYPIEEWSYFQEDRLVGVGYVDVLAVGLSAIYFFHDPELRQHGLGVWNVLSLLAEAKTRGLPHVYLGYFVAGCASLEYKATFRPNEVLHPDGQWRNFRGTSE